jgi:hypothetical protein
LSLPRCKSGSSAASDQVLHGDKVDINEHCPRASSTSVTCCIIPEMSFMIIEQIITNKKELVFPDLILATC